MTAISKHRAVKWMRANSVAFGGSISFPAPATTSGYLIAFACLLLLVVFNSDNPSRCYADKILLKDGRELDGIIVGETSQEIVFRRDGATIRLPKDRVLKTQKQTDTLPNAPSAVQSGRVDYGNESLKTDSNNANNARRDQKQPKAGILTDTEKAQEKEVISRSKQAHQSREYMSAVKILHDAIKQNRNFNGAREELLKLYKAYRWRDDPDFILLQVDNYLHSLNLNAGMPSKPSETDFRDCAIRLGKMTGSRNVEPDILIGVGALVHYDNFSSQGLNFRICRSLVDWLYFNSEPTNPEDVTYSIALGYLWAAFWRQNEDTLRIIQSHIEQVHSDDFVAAARICGEAKLDPLTRAIVRSKCTTLGQAIDRGDARGAKDISQQIVSSLLEACSPVTSASTLAGTQGPLDIVLAVRHPSRDVVWLCVADAMLKGNLIDAESGDREGSQILARLAGDYEKKLSAGMEPERIGSQIALIHNLCPQLFSLPKCWEVCAQIAEKINREALAKSSIESIRIGMSAVENVV